MIDWLLFDSLETNADDEVSKRLSIDGSINGCLVTSSVSIVSIGLSIACNDDDETRMGCLSSWFSFFVFCTRFNKINNRDEQQPGEMMDVWMICVYLNWGWLWLTKQIDRRSPKDSGALSFSLDPGLERARASVIRTRWWWLCPYFVQGSPRPLLDR